MDLDYVIYNQKNVTASRKVILPMLKNILEKTGDSNYIHKSSGEKIIVNAISKVSLNQFYHTSLICGIINSLIHFIRRRKILAIVHLHRVLELTRQQIVVLMVKEKFSTHQWGHYLNLILQARPCLV